MRAPNLSEAARVTRRLLNQYGPARLLRVEELAPGIFRGMLAGGAQALSAPGAADKGLSTMRTNVLYHGNVCLTRGNLHDHK